MNAPDHVREAHRWMRFAREDLATARSIVSDPTLPPRNACLLAQQAAEKALKAALVFLAIDFPLRHDLDHLRTLLPAGWRITSGYEYLSDLTDWIVEARYPGDWPDAAATDAQLALEQAEAVVEVLLLDLQSYETWSSPLTGE